MRGALICNIGIATGIHLASCSSQYLAHTATLSKIGCPKAADWSITNAALMPAGWRVFEVEFFEDIGCTQKLKPTKIKGSPSMSCETTFDVKSAFDKLRSTLWVSECGTESQCGFSQTTNERSGELRPIPNACQPLEAYLMVSFEEPVAVNCVRVLQASAPFAAEEITITAHLGQECYRCADGAIDVTTIAVNNTNATSGETDNTTTVGDSAAVVSVKVPEICSEVESTDSLPCYNTLIGTPGLLARIYDDPDLLDSFSSEPVTDWELYDIVEETTSLTLNYQISSESMMPEVSNNSFAVHWIGYIRIPTEGEYTFNIMSAGHVRFHLGNDTIIDNPQKAGSIGGTQSPDVKRNLKVDLYQISIEYVPLYEDDIAGIIFTWKGPLPQDRWQIVPHNRLMQRITQESKEQKVAYRLLPNQHCYPDRMETRFETYTSARAKCDTMNGVCGAVYGKNCESGFPTSSIYLCRIDFVNETSDENSCILAKYAVSDVPETTTQPPNKSGAFAYAIFWIIYFI